MVTTDGLKIPQTKQNKETLVKVTAHEKQYDFFLKKTLWFLYITKGCQNNGFRLNTGSKWPVSKTGHFISGYGFFFQRENWRTDQNTKFHLINHHLFVLWCSHAFLKFVRQAGSPFLSFGASVDSFLINCNNIPKQNKTLKQKCNQLLIAQASVRRRIDSWTI